MISSITNMLYFVNNMLEFLLHS